MDHSDLVAGLTPQERADLTRSANIPGIIRLTMHASVIIGSGWLIIERAPLWPLLMVVQGVAIIFLFTVLHETVHRTAFKDRWVNDAVARLCGILVVLPTDWFRCFHFAHHRFTQDPEHDPELSTAKPRTLGQYLIHLSGLPVWWSQLKTLIRNALGHDTDSFVRESEKAAVRWEARMMIAVYTFAAAVSFYAGLSEILFVWLLPVLLGQPFLRFFLLAEHGGCAYEQNMLANSRTTLTTLPFRWLTWNMSYHAEHHALPSVPFFRLPAFHQITRPHLGVVEDGYFRFHTNYLRRLIGSHHRSLG